MEMQNQVSLNLDDISKELWEQNLIVLKEGRILEYKTYDDLFEGYKSIKAVTFSSSPSFFDSISRNYQKADIILGLSTMDFKNGLEEIRNFKISKKIREKTFIDISDSTRDKIVNKELNVFYGNKGTLIHSKYYILYGDNSTRVIYGSANMSKQAFDESIKQAEIVAYFDNDNMLVKSLEKNFEYLKKQTSSFFIPKQIKYYKECGVAKPLTLEESQEMFYEDIQEIPEEMYSTMNIVNLEDHESDIEEYRYITQIMKDTTKKRKNKYIRKEEDEIKKIIKANYQNKIIPTTDRTKRVEDRSRILFEEGENGYPVIKYQAYDGDYPINISNYEYTIDCLKSSLMNIDNWLSTYKLSSDYTDLFGKRIMDIILAGFSSVFFKEYRERMKDNETIGSITKIPVFIILSGQAESGKSELLNYINKLLGNKSEAFAYDKLIGGKKIDTILGTPTTSGNRMPIMIDEANVSHFSKPENRLSTFIKSTSNDINTKAAIFFTTNTEDFSMPTATRRRSHVYRIENIFKKSEQRADYKAVLDSTDNTLFKIFCSKMVNHLNDKELYIKINHATKDVDYLYLAKKVFREMYDECEMPYPEYLSNELVDDYEAKGKEMWKELIALHKNEISVHVFNDVETLVIKSSMFQSMPGVRDKNLQSYMDYLPDYCKHGDVSNKMDILVKEKDLFIWLGINDPFKKKGIFKWFK